MPRENTILKAFENYKKVGYGEILDETPTAQKALLTAFISGVTWYRSELADASNEGSVAALLIQTDEDLQNLVKLLMSDPDIEGGDWNDDQATGH